MTDRAKIVPKFPDHPDSSYVNEKGETIFVYHERRIIATFPLCMDSPMFREWMEARSERNGFDSFEWSEMPDDYGRIRLRLIGKMKGEACEAAKTKR